MSKSVSFRTTSILSHNEHKYEHDFQQIMQNIEHDFAQECKHEYDEHEKQHE